MKYHINQATGEVGPCRARQRCPFGDLETDHYPSAAAATNAYEQSMANALLIPSRASDPVELSTLVNLEELRQDITDGFIDVREHDDDDALKILCYSKQTQFSGHWTEATKIARGLIIRSNEQDFADAEVIQRPWRKFFTLEQLSDNNWVLGDEEREGASVEAELAKIDFTAPAEVTDKMDGSLGILYRHPDGRPALSTKGSFGSDQASMYTRMLRQGELEAQAENLLTSHSNRTFLFELVGRDNRIVLDYPDEKIVMLGAVEKRDGHYISANEYEGEWNDGVTETMPARNVGEALALPDRPNREGVVIRILSNDPRRQMQLKVKQDDYKLLHRAVTGFSVNDMRGSIRDSGESLGELMEVSKSGDVTQLRGVRAQLDLLTAHPLLGEVRDERHRAYEKNIMPRLEKLSQANAYVNDLPQSFFEQENPAKAFALSIAGEKTLVKSDLFTLFQARLRGQSPNGLSGGALLKNIAREVNASTIRVVEE